jgi:ABC-2 type transport system ATP-binding protein
MEAIVTQHLSKTYRSLGRRPAPSLNDLNLSIRENEVFGFLGRNGAGKTTTIKILCSLLKADSGDAFILGRNVRTREAREVFGYLPEQPYFYEYLNPRETLDFYGRMRGLSAAQRAREWDRLSEALDLRGISDQRIKSFSKGMRQRIGFAVALVGDPPVLILDEPMSGLDPVGRRMLRELILQQRDAGKTIFFSSHVLGDVEQICDRVGILVKGRFTREGRIGELLGEHVQQVEVVASGLRPEQAAALAQNADYHRASEECDLFRVGDIAAANALAQAIHAAGGALAEFSPIRETLEDYFLREQEAGAHKETAA